MCIHRRYIHSNDHAITCQAIEKEVFKEVIFSSNIIKTSQSSRDGAYIKKQRRKKKSSKSLFKQKGKSIFQEEKNTSTSKILFDVIPFSPSPSYHLKNPFQNH
jgi:hypothetical protein